MDAWILDESPGSYRWGDIDPPPLAADEVRIRVVASALNHMDLWVTRGLPKPPLPHVPGCDVAGVVEEVGVGRRHGGRRRRGRRQPRRVARRRHRRPRQRQPDGAGLRHLRRAHVGRPLRAGDGAGANVVRRPASRSWEECAAYPLASLTAYRMLRRARLQAGQTVLVVGIGVGVSSCAALAIARHLGAEVARHQPQRGQAGRGAGDGARPRPTTRRMDAGRSRPTSSSRASARRRGTARCAPSRPAAGSSSAAGRRVPRSRSTCPGCSSSSTRSSARRWAATRSSPS